MNDTSTTLENERLEIRLLLEAIYLRYGFDFRDYSGAHTKRRLENRLQLSGMASYGEMQHRLIHDEGFFNELLLDLSINVTEMFRDPWFYRTVRENVVPHLKTYPFIRSWHAGCSAGQEVYSMCIVLAEEEMKERTQIYATDFNELILDKARAGIYPIELVRNYTANYHQAGGKKSFSDYYSARYDHAIINQELKERVLFSSHNLVTDGVFGEMHIIFCRNVLIYFNKNLQNRVLRLFCDTLCPGGFLCLGSKESLRFTEVAGDFECIAEKEKIYRKKRRS